MICRNGEFSMIAPRAGAWKWILWKARRAEAGRRSRVIRAAASTRYHMGTARLYLAAATVGLIADWQASKTMNSKINTAGQVPLEAVDRRRWGAIVAGAGPAGGMAAVLLASRGIPVLLVDHQSFPREKTCGEALIPEAMKGALEREPLRGSAVQGICLAASHDHRGLGIGG